MVYHNCKTVVSLIWVVFCILFTKHAIIRSSDLCFKQSLHNNRNKSSWVSWIIAACRNERWGYLTLFYLSPLDHRKQKPEIESIEKIHHVAERVKIKSSTSRWAEAEHKHRGELKNSVNLVQIFISVNNEEAWQVIIMSTMLLCSPRRQ